ncbi:MAG: hypothetical protein ACJ8HQ_00035 [Chthoniobacterales bacterium]
MVSGAKGIACSGLILFLAGTLHASPLFNLGAAKNFTVLQVGAGTVSQTTAGTQGQIVGNVGIYTNGKISSNGPQISGDLYLGNGSTGQFSGSYSNNRPVTGMAHLGIGASVGPGSYTFTTMSDNPQTLLNQARTDAMNASTAAQGLTATSALTKIDSTMTLSGSGVYNLTSVNLASNEVLTLSGNAGDSIVLNISDMFKLNDAKIVLTGGLLESNVLFNFVGTKDVNVAGNSALSELHGILLALNAKVALSPGLVVGEIISARDIAVDSGAIVRMMQTGPNTVPDNAPTFALLAVAFAAVIGAKRFVPRRLSA